MNLASSQPTTFKAQPIHETCGTLSPVFLTRHDRTCGTLSPVFLTRHDSVLSPVRNTVIYSALSGTAG